MSAYFRIKFSKSSDLNKDSRKMAFNKSKRQLTK